MKTHFDGQENVSTCKVACVNMRSDEFSQENDMSRDTLLQRHVPLLLPFLR